MIMGVQAGKIIDQKIRSRDAPSIVAASSKAEGMERINCLIKKIFMAPPPKILGMMSALMLPNKLSE